MISRLLVQLVQLTPCHGLQAQLEAIQKQHALRVQSLEAKLTDCLLPTAYTYYLLHTSHYHLLPTTTAYHILHTAYYTLPPTFYYALCSTHYALRSTLYALLTTHYALCTMHSLPLSHLTACTLLMSAS